MEEAESTIKNQTEEIKNQTTQLGWIPVNPPVTEEIKNQTEEIENRTEEIEDIIEIECPICHCGTIEFDGDKDRIRCTFCDTVWIKDKLLDMTNHRYCHFRVQDKNWEKDIKFTERHEAVCKKCKWYTEYGECLAWE